MELIGYKELETHRRVHRDFRDDTLPALEKELRRTDYSAEAVRHFLAVCAGWLIGHTLTEDRAITGQTASKWANLLPEEELQAMKEVILELLGSMFHLKARVISEAYGGENSAKASTTAWSTAGSRTTRSGRSSWYSRKKFFWVLWEN